MNGGFEQSEGDAAPGWQAINGTLRRTTGEDYAGDYAGQFTFAGPGSHSFYQTVGVVSGQQYRFSGSCKSTSPGLASLQLLLRGYATPDGTGIVTSSSVSPFLALPAASYQLLSAGSLTPPEAARSLRAHVQALGDGGEVDWARVTTVRVTYIGDYHD